MADVIIVGGGLVGATMALALAQRGLEIDLIDREPASTRLAPEHDGRASAIAAASRSLFEQLALPIADHGEPIRTIRVTDRNRGPDLQFAAEPGASFGLMLENRMIRHLLARAVADCPPIRVHAPAELVAWSVEPGQVSARLDNGADLSAPLLLAADGRQSGIRKHLGIRSALWDYGQTGVVTAVEHPRAHHGVAHEIFLPDGPLALLPLSGNRSSVVWSIDRVQAQGALDMPDARLAAMLTERSAGVLGELRLAARRWVYPLNFHHADRYGAARVMLIGDAAHGIHPIAGQGLNLALRDVAVLAELLGEAATLGLDLGDIQLLRRYERLRRPDNAVMCAATDGLTRLFSNRLPLLPQIRRFGLGLVGRSSMLKTFFVAQATGLAAQEGQPR